MRGDGNSDDSIVENDPVCRPNRVGTKIVSYRYIVSGQNISDLLEHLHEFRKK